MYFFPDWSFIVRYMQDPQIIFIFIFILNPSQQIFFYPTPHGHFNPPSSSPSTQPSKTQTD